MIYNQQIVIMDCFWGFQSVIASLVPIDAHPRRDPRNQLCQKINMWEDQYMKKLDGTDQIRYLLNSPFRYTILGVHVVIFIATCYALFIVRNPNYLGIQSVH